MRKNMTRFLSLLLCASMVLGMMPTAYAAEPEETTLATESVETEPMETEQTEPVETEPAETESVETEPAQTEPSETEPAETEAPETEPAETEPAETEPVETVWEEPQAFQAQGDIVSGTWENFAWKLDVSTGHLSISGSGDLKFSNYTQAPWLDFLSQIKTVDIAPGMNSVGMFAFARCSNLEQITIPETVTSIGEAAFYACMLKKVDLPASIRSIGSEAFFGCGTLTEITIPEEVQTIGDQAFAMCSGLRELVLPGSITTIGARAFLKCTSLEKINIPAQLQCIESGLFTDCAALKEITIPEQVKNIYSYAFGGCTSLTDIYYAGTEADRADMYIEATGNDPLLSAVWHYAPPSGTCGDDLTWVLEDGVLTISGTGAMWDYRYDSMPLWTNWEAEIKTVEIAPGVTSVGAYAFNNCYNLTQISIPDTVTSIGDDAFGNCAALEKVKLPADLRDIGDYAFSCCGVKEITIPEQVTNIGSRAFSYCTSLTSVTFQGRTVSIGTDAFMNCFLTDVYYPGTEADRAAMTIKGGNDSLWKAVWHYALIDSGTCGDDLIWELSARGVLTISGTGGMYTYNESNLPPWFGRRNDITAVVIDEGVSDIGFYAFYGCSSMREVSIPSSVASITYYAFSGCTSLEKAVIPEGVTYIGVRAFENCSGLTEVIFPKSVTFIGDQAFYSCSSLTEVALPEGLTALEDYVFWDCSNLKKVVIPEGVGTIGLSAFYNCTGLTSVSLPASVEVIQKYAFQGCESLTDVYYAGTDEDRAAILIQEENNTLTDATWHYLPVASGTCGDNLTWELSGSGVLTISGTGEMFDYESSGETNQAPWFAYRTEVTSAALDSGITSIGKFAFSQCENLVSVSIPEGVISIGSGAFANCAKLASIVIPEGVTSIEDITFVECNSLTEVVIPASVTEIGCAFQACTSLNSLTIPEGVTTIEEGTFAECHNLTAVVLPASLTFIGGYAFGNCKRLDNVVIPEGISTIEANLFWGCEGLTTLKLPKSITRIGECAFDKCTSLADVYYSGTEADRADIQIGADNEPLTNAAWHCHPALSGVCGENLTWAFDQENGVLTISGTGPMADFGAVFDAPPWSRYNEQISSVVVEEGVTSIGTYAFRYYTALTSVTLPTSLETIGEYAFDSCKALVGMGIPEGVTQIDRNAFSDCTGLTALTISSTVTSIGEFAFAGCSALKELTFRGLAVTMEELAFNSEALTDVYYPGTEATRAAFVELGSSKLYLEKAVWHYGGQVDADMTVAEGVCGTGVTWKLNASGNFTLSGSGEMEDYAEGTAPWNHLCSVIVSLAIEEGVTKVGSYAFSQCPKLITVSLPKSLTQVGESAFYNTYPNNVHFGEVTYAGSVYDRAKIRFGYGNDRLTDSAWTYAVETPGMITGSCGPSLVWILDENGTLTILGTGDMYNSVPWSAHLDRIRSVVIGEGVTYIVTDAFRGCKNLESIVIPKSVTSIYPGAFSACNSLLNVYYAGTEEDRAAMDISSNPPNAKWHYSSTGPEDAAELYGACGENAFWELVKATGELTISGSGTMFDYDESRCAPWMNTGIPVTSAVVGEKITGISPYAFSGCDALTQVTIPIGLTSVGESAFAGCTALKDVHYGGTVLSKPNIQIGTGNEALENAVWHCSTIVASGDCGPDAAWELDVEGGLTVSGTGKVTWNPWINEKYLDLITTVVVEEGITSLVSNAFRSIPNLKDAQLPSTVTDIPDSAFRRCPRLKTVTLPRELATVGQDAFGDCSMLTDVYYGGSRAEQAAISVQSGNDPLTAADWHYGIPSATSGTCGDNLTWTLGEDGTITISGTGAMWNYASTKDMPWDEFRGEITHVVVEDGVTYIGVYAFYGCAQLVDVVFPASVTAVGDDAFYGCKGLTDVYYGGWAGIQLGSNNEYLSNATWHHTGDGEQDILMGQCGDAVNWALDLKTGVLTISGTGDMYDYGYSLAPWKEYRDSVTSVVISEGINNISSYLFEDHLNLTAVTVPLSVSSVERHAFDGCSSLNAVYYAGTPNDWGKISINTYNNALHDAPHYYLSTGSEDVKADKCGDNVTWSLDNGVLTISGTGAMWDYNKYSTTRTIVDTPWYARRSEITSVVVTEGVTRIGKYAFYAYDNLIRASVPGSVTAIGEGAFEDVFFSCRNMAAIYYAGTSAEWQNVENGWFPSQKVFFGAAGPQDLTGSCGNKAVWTLGEDGTLTISGTGAMWGYNGTGDVPWYENRANVETVVIEPGITSIGSYAFQSCNNATEAVISDTVKVIGTSAFASCSALTEVVLPEGITAIRDYTFSGCWALTSVNIPGSVTAIGMSAFGQCENLTELVLPQGLTSIGSSAFSGCEKLTELVIPEGVTTIEYGAFRTCKGLTNMVLPDSVTSIGNGVFSDCISLASVVLPDGITEIPYDTFRGCSTLTDVTIPDSVTKIGFGAFYGCARLPSITIPGKVTEIGMSAFKECGALETVTLPKALAKVEGAAFQYCDALTDVYYAGTEADRAKISIGTLNDELNNAVWHYGDTGLTETAPVYRLYNPYTMEHLFLSSEAEYDSLGAAGWVQEGVAWYAPVEGAPVYRLYNAFTDGHFYTVSETEKDNCIAAGWIFDGVVSYSADPPALYSGTVKASSLNIRESPSMTSNAVGQLTQGAKIVILEKNGDWGRIQEGWILLQFVELEEDLGGRSVPIYRMFNPFEEKNYHHYTASESERDTLAAAGWVYEGVAWYADHA